MTTRRCLTFYYACFFLQTGSGSMMSPTYNLTDISNSVPEYVPVCAMFIFSFHSENKFCKCQKLSIIYHIASTLTELLARTNTGQD